MSQLLDALCVTVLFSASKKKKKSNVRLSSQYATKE